MGDEIKKEIDAEIELVAGSGGVFDISMDGRMIFSKFEQGRYPQPDEIISLIKVKVP